MQTYPTRFNRGSGANSARIAVPLWGLRLTIAPWSHREVPLDDHHLLQLGVGLECVGNDVSGRIDGHIPHLHRPEVSSGSSYFVIGMRRISIIVAHLDTKLAHSAKPLSLFFGSLGGELSPKSPAASVLTIDQCLQFSTCNPSRCSDDIPHPKSMSLFSSPSTGFSTSLKGAR